MAKVAQKKKITSAHIAIAVSTLVSAFLLWLTFDKEKAKEKIDSLKGIFFKKNNSQSNP